MDLSRTKQHVERNLWSQQWTQQIQQQKQNTRTLDYFSGWCKIKTTVNVSRVCANPRTQYTALFPTGRDETAESWCEARIWFLNSLAHDDQSRAGNFCPHKLLYKPSSFPKWRRPPVSYSARDPSTSNTYPAAIKVRENNDTTWRRETTSMKQIQSLFIVQCVH